MTIDTADEELAKRYSFFTTELQPRMAPYDDFYNKKLIESEYTQGLTAEGYSVYLRSIRKAIELYREGNIDLKAKDTLEAQKFGTVMAAQTIEHDGEKMTMGLPW